nr:unnamed protein product [Callosobruchus chinensis]
MFCVIPRCGGPTVPTKGRNAPRKRSWCTGRRTRRVAAVAEDTPHTAQCRLKALSLFEVHPKPYRVTRKHSSQLRDSVQCLLVQWDDRNKEIEKKPKAAIVALESEEQKGAKF